ncbi:MAG TPA: twin-arginine translocation signal domain-containing protein [Vicinamibacterales bacterium]|nr:twin-arginine translocation signal domain-containing protein [Vicinamibacterales bacterium]
MKEVSRRRALKTLGAAAAAGGVLRIPAADGSVARLQSADAISSDALMPLAEVVLPAELGADGHHEAVAAFVRWLRNYKEGADTDHGYGNTRIRSTGRSPARNYPAQLTAMDDAARAKGAASFAAASVDTRRELVEAALAAANIERLPSRPDGAHVAADLMAHYFNSPDAEDLCYHAAIGRDSCRGLPGSEARPAPLKK